MKKQKKSIIGKIYKTLVFILVFLIFSSVYKNYSKYRSVRREVARLNVQKEKILKENKEIEAKIKEIQTEDYMDKEIRNKFGYAKTGEVVIVLPPDEEIAFLVPQVEEEEIELPQPNWKKWLKMFDIKI